MNASKPEPTPIIGDESVVDLVIADMQERREFGIRKYGGELMTHNRRDPLMDAYQEALDLALYLRQAIAERKMNGK